MNAIPRIEIGDMPGLLREVGDAAGVTAALRLARVFGGVPVYIPHRIKPGHALIEAAGAAAADFLSANYAGETVLVPLGPEADAGRKRRAIRGRMVAGRSNRQIARELHCHIRTVERERVRLRGGADSRQLSLLD